MTDASGAVVPNAQVVITDLGTNATRETKTNAQGDYRVFGLSAGAYKVTVTSSGMDTAVLTGIRLNGSDTIGANAVLKVAATSQAVEVTSEVPLVNTENQTISDNITSSTVIDLPRDSRDVYSFLYLNPNITQSGKKTHSNLLARKVMARIFPLMAGVQWWNFRQCYLQRAISGSGRRDQRVVNDIQRGISGVANIRVTTKRGSSTIMVRLLQQ